MEMRGKCFLDGGLANADSLGQNIPVCGGTKEASVREAETMKGKGSE